MSAYDGAFLDEEADRAAHHQLTEALHPPTPATAAARALNEAHQQLLQHLWAIDAYDDHGVNAEHDIVTQLVDIVDHARRVFVGQDRLYRNGKTRVIIDAAARLDRLTS